MKRCLRPQELYGERIEEAGRKHLWRRLPAVIYLLTYLHLQRKVVGSDAKEMKLQELGVYART